MGGNTKRRYIFEYEGYDGFYQVMSYTKDEAFKTFFRMKGKVQLINVYCFAA